MARKMKNSGIQWIGEIPSDWNLNKIQYCLLEIKDKNLPIQTSQVLSLVKDKGVILYEDKGNVGNKAKKNITEYKLAYPNTLIINSMNILIGSVGISNYFGCVSPVYYVFKETNKADLRFINYIFNTREMQAELRKYANGIMEIRLRVSANDIFKRKIPLPPIDEQKKIADYLDEKCTKIDSLVKDIQSQIDILEDYKKSVITEAVTKGLNPNVEMKDSGIEWIGEIPKKWRCIKSKYIFIQRSERGNKISLELLSPTQKFGVIPQRLYEELTTNTAVKIQENTNLEMFKTIHKGDYCISLRSFQGGFEYSYYEGVVSPAYQVFYPIQNIFEGYYKYLFKSQSFINKMNSYTMSLRDGKNIAFSDFGNTYIPVPPVDEQKKIANFLDLKCEEINNVIKDKKEQLDVLEQYKKSLIYEYVTGKKEVK